MAPEPPDYAKSFMNYALFHDTSHYRIVGITIRLLQLSVGPLMLSF
jgi:hypothetical protein